MRNTLRLLTTAVLGAATITGTATSAHAEDIPTVPWDRCDNICVYQDYNFTGEFAPNVGRDLDWEDWDNLSSVINNTDDDVCTYSYDEYGDAYLVDVIGPHNAASAGQFGSDTNDTVDRIESMPRIGTPDDANACPDVLPSGINPDVPISDGRNTTGWSDGLSRLVGTAS